MEMKSLTGERIYGLRDEKGGITLQNLEFTRCEFWNCHIFAPPSPERRVHLKSIAINDCKAVNSTLDGAIIEDVSVHGFSSNDLFIIFGSVFRRTTLSGRVSSVKINTSYTVVDRSPRIQAKYDEDRERFYQEDAWPLDISNARFRNFDYEGIPSSRFIRDSESQPVFRRRTVEQLDWRNIISGMSWRIKATLTSWMERTVADADIVFVVPLDAKKDDRDKLLSEIAHLRRIGLAERD